MEYIFEIGLFTAKWLVSLIAILALLIGVIVLVAKSRQTAEMEVEDLNERYSDFRLMLSQFILDKKALKKQQKELKKERESSDPLKRPRLYVLDFNGDVQASQVEELRNEVSAVLSVSAPGDQVLICIESPGGTVHGYGLAAAQILRLKSAGLEVVASVDKVAASGGYLMACTASKIISAPFAILGSIGVVAQVPNIHRLLKKNEIDYEEITSGEFKRTVSIMGEITEKGRKKFTEQIEDTHQLFKDFVARERSQVNINEVATGEYWFGFRAKELKLVDQIQTSDEFLFSAKDSHRILRLNMKSKEGIANKLKKFVGELKGGLSETFLKRFFEPRV